MVFSLFTMPCLHDHHHQPPILHARDSDDVQISSSAAVGLTVGITLIVVIIAAIAYLWCWRQSHRHRRSRRRRRSESRHRRENQQEQANTAARGNDERANEAEQTTQGQNVAAQTDEGPPPPTIPLTVHHHQHEDKHFHGAHCRNHHDHCDQQHENIQDSPGDSDFDLHHVNYRRHRRFNRAQRIFHPQDPIAEAEEPIQPQIQLADLEAILNRLDIPLANGRADVAANEEKNGRREEKQREKRRKRHHRHHHHCHHRHRRVLVH
jgi:hypothetical protein